MQVSTADLALILGISDRRVQQLETTGVLRKVEHGEWDLPEAVQAYVRHRLQAKRKQSPAGGKADEKLKAAKAAREELKLAVEERALIPTAEAIATIDDAIGTIRAGLAGVPARITRDMALRDRVETEIDVVLGRAADQFAEWASALEPFGEPDQAGAEDDPGSLGSDEP